MRKIIFACIHNAGRSQMAAAFFNGGADPSLAHAVSAGTEPADQVHPQVMEAMREVGFDLSEAIPRLLTHELAGDADLLVTMGCGESCPSVPGLATEDWPLPDPRGQGLESVRTIRDQIRARINNLLRTRYWL